MSLSSDRAILMRAAQLVDSGAACDTDAGFGLHYGGWFSCHAIEAAANDSLANLRYVYREQATNQSGNYPDWWNSPTHVAENKQARVYALLLFREALKDLQ